MRKNTRLFFVLSALTLSLVSCKNEETYVNDWIYENMDIYYYWTNHIPSKTDKSLAPDAYFESLLYKFDSQTAPDGDRFSWIQDDWQDLEDMLNGVVPNEIGFDYRLYLLETGSELVAGQIAYIKKGTPAYSSDLVRGTWFNKVNGIQLTTSNYGSLMSVTDDQVTFGLLDETFTDEGDFIGFVVGPSITVHTVADYAENPVYMDSVYVIGSSRVGYLVYNFFAQDNGDESLDYDVAMNHVFGRFKNNHITDLVLDLRYNSGGRAISSKHLASMIVPGLDESDVFAFLRYNDYWNNYYIDKYGESELNTYFTNSIKKGSDIVEEINNVGANLTRLYVLTGDFTASASEEIINGLKPYMDVILIGETTYGKNVGSISIYEENDPKNTWAMQLIIAKFFNSRGESDFTEGFEPDYPMMDTGIVGIKPLGDTTENLLNKALSLATGSQVAASVVTRGAIIQKDKVLRAPSQVHRGLQLEKPNHFN